MYNCSNLASIKISFTTPINMGSSYENLDARILANATFVDSFIALIKVAWASNLAASTLSLQALTFLAVFHTLPSTLHRISHMNPLSSLLSILPSS
jgi:hypothetical protein